jgi:hypothetical protein
MAVVAGCNAQFDFDTQPLDAEAPDAAKTDVSEPDVNGPAGIACGTSVCSVPGHTCCVRPSGSECIEAAGADCTGISIRCDSAADCRAGTVCCATIIDSVLMSIHCEEATECASAGRTVLCDPNEPSACASCDPAPAPLPSNYHVCR